LAITDHSCCVVGHGWLLNSFRRFARHHFDFWFANMQLILLMDDGLQFCISLIMRGSTMILLLLGVGLNFDWEWMHIYVHD
jgi:hypothetical protein